MDFMNRSNAPAQHHEAEPTSPVGPAASGINVKRSSNNKKSFGDDGKWTRIGIFAGVLAIVVLFIALIILIGANNNNSGDKSEASYIKTSKMQAVFLNTGQVYFGNITTLNNNYVVLTNIFYLQTASNGSGSSASSSTSNSNVTLVKLGCELHRPYDQMVINRSQVTFWENLQSDGQVATAVATYQKNNPGPQKCVDQSTSAGTSTGNSAQGATNNNGSTP